jgi:hypothetical protein
MGFAAPGSFRDLGSLVLGDHALELDQQLVFGGLGARCLHEADFGASPSELVDEQRLVGVATGEAVRRVAQHHIHGHLGGQIAQAFEGGTDQCGAREALVLENPLGGDVKPPVLGGLPKRRHLRRDRLLVALAG